MQNVQPGWTHTEVPFMTPTLRTLVILDADAGVSQMLSIWCQAEAYSPVVASDTDEFIRLVRLLRPEGAILDADRVRPEECDRLAQFLIQPPNNTMPLILTTWSESKDLPVEAAGKVTMAMLSKPFSLVRLKETLELLTGGNRN